MPSNFLQPGECLADYPDSECGAFNGRVSYNGEDYQCIKCLITLDTETDLDMGEDTFEGGDSSAGEGEDDEQNDSIGGPIDAPLVSDTPEEKMERNVQANLSLVIEELLEGEGDTDLYTLYFVNNFDEIVSFYMLFTKYGPTPTPTPSTLKEKLLEISCAYMMMNEKVVRFHVLATVTGYRESELVKAAIRYIERARGDDYRKGAELIEIYAPSMKIPENFIEPMQKIWLAIKQPRGDMRARVAAFIGEYYEISKGKITNVKINEATGVNRSILARLRKKYKAILEELLKS